MSWNNLAICVGLGLGLAGIFLAFMFGSVHDDKNAENATKMLCIGTFILLGALLSQFEIVA